MTVKAMVTVRLESIGLKAHSTYGIAKRVSTNSGHDIDEEVR